MNNLSQAVRIAVVVIGAALLIYFGLGVIRHGAPKIGGAAGQMQDKF